MIYHGNLFLLSDYLIIKLMMEVTNFVCTGVHRSITGKNIQFVPQITSTLRRELVFWKNHPDQSTLGGEKSF